jgi:hypothetical protein
MRVTVEQLTFEDFAEAAAAVRGVAIDRQRRQARRSGALVVVGLAFGALILGVTSIAGRIDPTPDLRPAPYPMINIGLPLFSLLAFAGVITAAQQAGSRGQFVKRSLVIALPTFAAAALLAVLVWLLSANRPPAAGVAAAATPAPVDWYGTFAPHVVWVIGLAMFALVVVRAVRQQLRVAWETTPSITRIKVYDITAGGVHVDERVTQRTYQWLAFERFIETTNLLLLCPTELTFEIVPKRAFASADDLDTARALFAAQISPPGARPAGFPVLPAGTGT